MGFSSYNVNEKNLNCISSVDLHPGTGYFIYHQGKMKMAVASFLFMKM